MRSTSIFPPRVLVVLASANTCHRLYLQGILNYAKNAVEQPWDVVLNLRNIDVKFAIDPAERGFDAVIAAVHNSADRRLYLKSGLPTVLFEPTIRRPIRSKQPANSVIFLNDHAAEGIAAAEYYLRRGYTSFAYVGTPVRTAWSDLRCRGFICRLERAGKAKEVYIYPLPPERERTEFSLEAPRLMSWLSALPPHTAVFAAHDERAQQIVSCAVHAGIEIPRDIAVLGVDNDELLCSTASPMISSIAVDAQNTGYHFAKALDDLMRGRKTEPVVRLCHTAVISRRSTEEFVLPDAYLSRALSYAASHLSSRPRIADLAREARCSKRTLQLRALRVLGHSLKEEITRIQLDMARRSLTGKTADAEVVARANGFCSAAHMRRRFKNKFSDES